MLPQHSRLPQRFYRPELDALRLLAFASVFVFHACVWSPLIRYGVPQKDMLGTAALACSSGMCLFFVLSSFLITTLLLMEREDTGVVNVRAFYVRRMLRIWPLYFAFLIPANLIGLVNPNYAMGRWRFLAFVFFSGNWYEVFNGDTYNPAAPLWSISLEEQFYLLWPTLALLGGRRAIAVASAITIPVAWLAIFWGGHPYGRDTFYWFNSLVQFQYFGIGALLAIAVRHGRGSQERSVVSRICGVSVGLALWLLGTWLEDRVGAPIEIALGYTVVGLGCVLIFYAFLNAPLGAIPKGAVYLGKISYGLYVFHWASEITWHLILGHFDITPFHHYNWYFPLRTLASLATAIGLASLSYRFLEMPFLKLKERFAVVRSRPPA